MATIHKMKLFSTGGSKHSSSAVIGAMFGFPIVNGKGKVVGGIYDVPIEHFEKISILLKKIPNGRTPIFRSLHVIEDDGCEISYKIELCGFADKQLPLNLEPTVFHFEPTAQCTSSPNRLG